MIRFLWYPVTSIFVESIIPTKRFPNNKLWVTKELKNILNIKKRVFLSGSNEEKNIFLL